MLPNNIYANDLYKIAYVGILHKLRFVAITFYCTFVSRSLLYDTVEVTHCTA